MKKFVYTVLGILLVLIIVSCAAKVYSRVLVFKSENTKLRIKETLTLNNDKFRFVKETVKGKAVFEGTFREKKNQWIFEIKHFKPVNAAARFFNPPIIYVYAVRKYAGGVIFNSPKVKGPRSPLQFIMRGSFSAK